MMGPGGIFMLIWMLAISLAPFILSFLLDRGKEE